MTELPINNRDKRIDFYKALLMFSVVWGHTINIMLNGSSCACNISWFLRTFDMPMFMFLSGFFLKFSIKKYSISSLLINKTSYILFPAVIWSLLVSFGHKPYTLYFLWAVYLSSVVVVLIERSRNKILKIVLYLSLTLIVHLTRFDFVNLSYLAPFFLLGFYRKSLEKNYIWMVPIYVLLICFWNADYSIWKAGSFILGNPNHMLKVVSFRFLVGCVGLFSMKLLFDIIYDYINQSCFTPNATYGNFGGGILNIGRETLAIYIFQAIATYGILRLLVKNIVQMLGYNPFMWNERLLIYIISPLLSVFILFISLKTIHFFRTYYYLDRLFGFKMIKEE